MSANSYERTIGWVYCISCLIFVIIAFSLDTLIPTVFCMVLISFMSLQSDLRDALRRGDIRFHGVPKAWPHDSAVFGVPRCINKEGFQLTVGRIGTSVLCVGSGSKAYLNKGERLVILSPDSSVVLADGTIYYSSEIPMGEVDGIPDARCLYIRSTSGDEFLATGIYFSKRLTIIATGSAGRMTGWAKYLERTSR